MTEEEYEETKERINDIFDELEDMAEIPFMNLEDDE